MFIRACHHYRHVQDSGISDHLDLVNIPKAPESMDGVLCVLCTCVYSVLCTAECRVQLVYNRSSAEQQVESLNVGSSLDPEFTAQLHNQQIYLFKTFN